MARSDIPPEDRDIIPLQLEALVDCPCGQTFDAVFTAPEGVYGIEDLVDPPVQPVTCPACGATWEAIYPGWCVHEDAG